MVDKNKSNRYMYSIVMIAILVAGVVIVSLFVIKPFYSSAVSVTNQVSSSQKQLNKLESQESKLESLKNQETELDQEAATVSEALPTTNDVGRLFIQLSDLANNAGGSISGVTGGTTVGTTSTTSPASTTATTSASVPGVEVLTYSMPISFSSYFNFKNFLTSASSALRLISVNNITVSASSTGEITAGLNLTTYMRSQ